MYRSKSLNYHYLTNDSNKNNRFIDQTIYDNEIEEINPYSSVSILNDKKFYNTNLTQKYLSNKYDFQLNLIPRIKLPRRHKTFSKKEHNHLSQITNNQKSFQDLSHINLNNQTFPNEVRKKVKLRDKNSFNFIKNNITTRFSIQNSVTQNVNDKDVDQRRKNSVSQIISYFNECSEKNWDDNRYEEKCNVKNFKSKDLSLDENQNMQWQNSIKIVNKKSFKELRDCNIQNFVSTKPSFFKKNCNNYNGQKKEGIIYNNNDHSVTIKNINYIPDKFKKNYDINEEEEHIYERVPEGIICSDKVKQKQYIPPFIRKFSVFPPDLTFKPRSFKSFLCKNNIY